MGAVYTDSVKTLHSALVVMQLHKLGGNRDIHLLSLLSFSNVRYVHLDEVLKYLTKRKDDQSSKHVLLHTIHTSDIL